MFITTHIVNFGTWHERWFVYKYEDRGRTYYSASCFGVNISGYSSLDSLIMQLNIRKK